jgi:stage IV sporulation protein FB
MQDFTNFSLPLFRAYGVQVRLHLLYIVMTLGILFRSGMMAETTQDWIEFAVIWVVLLFVIILLHEFGHCFAARSVDGSANEILMWPLGGLAYCDAPRTVRAQFITAAGGPFVNLVICLAVAIPMLLASYLPPLNPFKLGQVMNPTLYHLGDGKNHVAADQIRYVKQGSDELVSGVPILRIEGNKIVMIDPVTKKTTALEFAQVGTYPSWILWLARIFWLSWFNFLFNLLPAFPMDGGRFFQCLVWWRSDYRTGTTWACYSGYGFALVFLVGSIAFMDPMLGFLGFFIWYNSYRQLLMLQMGDDVGYGEYGGGYGGYDEDEPKPKKKKLGLLQRWSQARRIKRIQKEEAERVAEQTRLDELLDKVHQFGLGSLSDEEKRFMNRVSARYKNNRS